MGSNHQYQFCLPNIHLEICVTNVKQVLKISRNRDINSSFPIFKCLWTKRFRIRNIIISMKQRSIIVASKHRINETKILKCSLMGPIKNLQVKKGVLNIALAITALHIWAKSLFFIDLFQSDTSKDDKIKIISWHRVTYLFNLFVFLDVKSFYLLFRLHLLGSRCITLTFSWDLHQNIHNEWILCNKIGWSTHSKMFLCHDKF